MTISKWLFIFWGVKVYVKKCGSPKLSFLSVNLRSPCAESRSLVLVHLFSSRSLTVYHKVSESRVVCLFVSAEGLSLNKREGV